MSSRYQIFVSSTFRDLQGERQAALDAILELGHFPAGMEIFPAANATPWALIDAMISESDYYILIIGGMYGSTDEEGISYTEREYELACAKGVPVLAFLHKNPDIIPLGMSELSPESRARLALFRTKVQTHHCKYWLTQDELKSHTLVGLVHEMRVNPRLGWIRADQQDSRETLRKLTALMEENANLQDQMLGLRESLGQRTAPGAGLASGSDLATINITMLGGEKKDETIDLTWDSIFLAVAPILMSECEEWAFEHTVASFVKRAAIERQLLAAEDQQRAKLSEGDYMKIVYQLMALDLIEPITIVEQTEIMGTAGTNRRQGYKLTKHGVRALASKRAILKQVQSD